MAVGVVLYETRADAIVVFAYLFVSAAICTAKTRGGLQNYSLLASTVFVVLLIATIVTTLCEPHLVSTVTKLDKPEAKLFARRAIVGWGPGAPGRYRVKHVLDGRLVYDATYTINPDLLRKVDSGSVGKGIAFVGDSYVFGDGIQDDATLPQQFADLEGRRAPVYNLGFSAYSPAQALAEMRAGLYDKQLNNSRAIVEFIAPWQADRVTCKASFMAYAPRFVQSDGKILQDGICSHIPPSPLAYFSIYRFVQTKISVVRDSDIAIFTAITREVIRLAREKYKVPIVIYYLRAPGYVRRLRDWDDDKIIQNLRAAGAEILEYDFPSDPRYGIRGDGHPTGLENADRARSLFDFLRQKFPNIEAPAGP